MRATVHLATAFALAALALAFGRWLRDPAPGGPLLILLGAAILWAVAAGRLYARAASAAGRTAASATSCGSRGSGRAACVG